MSSFIGHFLLILSMVSSILQFVCPLKKTKYLSIFSFVTFFSICLTFFWLMYLYVVSDFSVVNVFLNSHTEKPFLYKIVGVWGTHEGSMLLWAFLIVIISLLVVFKLNSSNYIIYGFILKQIGFFVFSFILFIFTTSDPFLETFPIPVEGKGLNPLLQDPLLAIHPPILYTGYSFLVLVFTMSIAIVNANNINKKEFFYLLYPWVLISWFFLTLGLILGSYWAYYQLGWGGWWFWDPVENISLLPWLLVAANVHLLNNLKNGSNNLISIFLCSTLSLLFSLFSTFLIRSGMLSSVHSFADDGGRGFFLLLFVFLLSLISLKSFMRLKKIRYISNPLVLFSKKSLLYLASLIFFILLVVTFLGVIYPLFIDKILNKKVTVVSSYFLRTFVPVSFLGLILTSFSLMFVKNLFFSYQNKKYTILFLSLLALLSSYYLLIDKGFLFEKVAWGLFLSLFLLFMTFYGVFCLICSKGFIVVLTSSMGVIFGHFGLALCCIGMCLDRGLGVEKDMVLSPGDSFSLKGLNVHMKNVNRGMENNFFYERVVFDIFSNGKFKSYFFTEKRFFKAHKSLTIKVGRFRLGASELYVVPGLPIGETETRSFRIQYRAYVYFVWGGGIIISFGILLSSIIALRRKNL